MYHGKYANKRKPSLLTWVLLCAALLTTVIGGVVAYLSLTSDLENQFSTAKQPTVEVVDQKIKVNPQGYSVYLRVAVDAYWWHPTDQSILAEEPTVNLKANSPWKVLDDGFYYYSAKVGPDVTEIELPVVIPAQAKAGYELKYTVVAQVVQAIGMTDDGAQSAVQNAWGVTPQQIENP